MTDETLDNGKVPFTISVINVPLEHSMARRLEAIYDDRIAEDQKIVDLLREHGALAGRGSVLEYAEQALRSSIYVRDVLTGACPAPQVLPEYAHAKNTAHRLPTAHVLFNVDADNNMGPGFARLIERNHHTDTFNSFAEQRARSTEQAQKIVDLLREAGAKQGTGSVLAYAEIILSHWNRDNNLSKERPARPSVRLVRYDK